MGVVGIGLRTEADRLDGFPGIPPVEKLTGTLANQKQCRASICPRSFPSHPSALLFGRTKNGAAQHQSPAAQVDAG